LHAVALLFVSLREPHEVIAIGFEAGSSIPIEGVRRDHDRPPLDDAPTPLDMTLPHLSSADRACRFTEQRLGRMARQEHTADEAPRLASAARTASNDSRRNPSDCHAQ